MSNITTSRFIFLSLFIKAFFKQMNSTLTESIFYIVRGGNTAVQGTLSFILISRLEPKLVKRTNQIVYIVFFTSTAVKNRPFKRQKSNVPRTNSNYQQFSRQIFSSANRLEPKKFDGHLTLVERGKPVDE